ncbi:hypothetical protein A0H81_05869 [Grifola frondosa]|uniref:Cryptic loci regulator 2 N-terminal domain-containing protein n=1 Tax=Grifola frondosa TaxID=5627 RepID=A0A1C7MC52_GRIFR|nr:hypothetical protein A0H81_05869 [Grifola frondosa]
MLAIQPKFPDSNPTWLEFPRTDGDASILPTNTQKIVDHDGHVNFMRPVGLDESTSINWRVGVATQLAKRMNLPEGPKYVLKTFPEGYHMYDHNKGPQSAPRHDPYLCGSVNVNRFRSVNEFIPHALWLMQDATMDRHNCECKYCAKQPQRAVTAALGLPGQRSPSVITSAPTRGPRPPREPRPRLTKPYAAVRPAPKPVKALTGPQQFLTPERNGDIMYALAHGDDRASRWFRKGELVWCALAPAIRGRTAEEDIIFWPGLVEEVHLKTQRCHECPRMASAKRCSRFVVCTRKHMMTADETRHRRPSTPRQHLRRKGRTSWKVRQWNVYKMKLLAVTHNYIVTDEQVVPYLAYAPSGQLLHAVTEVFTQIMSEIPIEEMDDNIQKVYTFDPLGPEDDMDGGFILKFRQAVMPYTLAIEIASNLASYWLPTDDWNCKFTITPPPLPPQPNRNRNCRRRHNPNNLNRHPCIRL